MQPQPNLTPTPKIITTAPTHFIYLEKRGPFVKYAPLAWKEFREIAKGHFAPKHVIARAGLSRVDYTQEGDNAFIYQAGLMLHAAPAAIPAGLQLRELLEGNYARFVLTGAYSQLPAAYPAIFKTLDASEWKIRDEFCIERYLNAPGASEEEQETEILIPIC